MGRGGESNGDNWDNCNRTTVEKIIMSARDIFSVLKEFIVCNKIAAYFFLFCKSLVINMLGFASHWVSVATPFLPL